MGALLIYGGTVLTLDVEGRVLVGGELLIQDDRVAAVGRNLTVTPGTEVLDAEGCLVLPGLIQGHVHLGQTFFRGLAEERRLLSWLRQRIWPLEAAHDDDSAYACALLGAAECLLGGTTTVQDIGIGPGVAGLLAALRDARLRAVAGKCLMDRGDDLPAALAEDTDRTLAETETLGRRCAGDDRLRYVLNPRFILSCSDELWRGVRELTVRHGWPVHTHALEQREEAAEVRRIHGRDEIAYFDDFGILDADLRIAHGVWLEEGHLERVRGRRFAVVHCPSSNLKLGSGIADLMALRRASIPVGVGCDGAACSNHLDAFEELRLAALLQKLQHGPESFTGRDALALATREGARALALEDEIGSLEVGKRADVVILAGDRPELWAAPGVDPHDLVAFSASRANVRDVFVGGEKLVDGGRLVHLDLADVRRRADREMAKLLDRAKVDW